MSLPRTLGLWSSVGLVVGITIGSGIFRSPAAVAQLVPNAGYMLGLWVLGGVITLCGALSLAELGAALPETGGYYVYLREGWGRPAAFVFGWAQLVLIRAAALGGIALVFGEYALRSAGVDVSAHYVLARGLAVAGIAFAAIINILGVSLGALVVRLSTGAKFLALGLVIVAALGFGGGHGGSLEHLTAPAHRPIGPGALGLGLVSVLWAYDGFGDLSFVGGEIRNPRTNLPRATIFGTIAIVGVYVLANVAYLYVNPIETVARSPLIAADTMMALFGRAGTVLVTVLVMISTYSALNADVLATPRVFFAMAEDGLFFSAIARVHRRYRTPYAAITLAAMLGIALVLSQSFERLSNMFVLAIWPFYALSVGALFRLRRRRPDLARPSRTFGYPIVPAVFIATVVWFVTNALVTDPAPTMVTFALILTGLPVYYFLFSRGAPPPHEHPSAAAALGNPAL